MNHDEDLDDDPTEPTEQPLELDAEPGPQAIHLEAHPMAGLPLVHARFRLIQDLTIRNPTGKRWEDVVVRVSTEPEFAEPWSARLERLDPYRPHALDPKLSLSPEFFRSQTERESARLVVTLEADGEERARQVHDLVLTPPNHWPGVSFLPTLLAAWVRPASPALPTILKRAADRMEALTESRGLDGYQSGDPRRVYRLAQAGWEAIQGLGIDYVDVPPSFENIGQKILTPSQVSRDGLGCCLDLAILMASVWERMGLHPFLVVVRGHAFAGVWLTDYALPEPTLDDPRPLRKRIDTGDALVVDSSPVTQKVSFDEARRGAEAQLTLDAFVTLIDVKASRVFGVHPLPGDGPAQTTAGDAPSGSPVPDAPDLSDILPEGRWIDDTLEADTGSRDRVDIWKSKLLDLSLRNRLLNFRVSSTTVSFPFNDPGVIEDRLADEEAWDILPRPPIRITDAASDEDRAKRRAEELGEAAEGLQGQGRLVADMTKSELGKSLLKIYRRARTAYEESGATTLYLTLGALSWFEDDRSDVQRFAPILLVPVELVRPKGKGPWRLRAAEEEARVNVTLLQKLQADFGLDTTGLDHLPEDGSGIDVARVLARFRRALMSFSRWEITTDVWLGQFSFAKFLMWLDLEAKREDLARNPVVAQMFQGARGDGPSDGPSTATPQLVEESKLDSARPTQDTLTVMDADPSQLQAILAAVDGGSFVLQGPPGTGKSQTITNLIAKLLAAGRTVLFVSEKLAALTVVQRRLEGVGLGPFCLELHAHQGSKAQVAQQLKEAFAYANQRTPHGWQAQLDDLQALREELNAHAARLARPSPFDAEPTRNVLATLFGLRDVPRILLDPHMGALDADAIGRCREAAHELAIALPDVGQVGHHPWRGVRRARWAPAWERDVHDAVQALAQTATRMGDAIQAIRKPLGWPADDAADAPLDLLVALARSVLATPSPAPAGALLTEPDAQDRFDTLDARSAEGRQLTSQRDALRLRWRDGVLQTDLEALRARHERWGASFLVRVFTLWTARGTLKPLATDGLPDEAIILDDLELAITVRDGQAEVESWTGDMTRWMPRTWDGLDTDWDAVARAITWARALVPHLLALRVDDALRPVHERAVALVTSESDTIRPGAPFHAPFAELGDAVGAFEQARTRVVELLDLDATMAWGADAAPADISTWCRQAAGSLDRLRAWCAGARAMALMKSAGLQPVVDAVADGRVSVPDVERTVDRALREAWWSATLERDPILANFRGSKHADVVARFRELDAESKHIEEHLTVAKVAARVPDLQGPGDELALLRRELLKQRRHMPVRKLFAEVGGVLSRLKPCVLMSPLSVAQFLDPSLEGFDVVVFDEASQIPPWDAIGAIARGSQAVIVGDSKQLPPTSFFARTSDAEPDENDIVELESVLDEAIASGMQTLDLRWHYRSQHESLIAFSNFRYYDNRLHTFPSADHGAEGVGVEFLHVPDGHYDRGGSRTNQREAEEVIRLIEEILDGDGTPPTIGVVTFSMAQQGLILDMAEALQQRRPDLIPHFADGAEEPVFIKNLENVQGDERDVMLFSIGYGPDQNGRLTLNLGPLTRDGGERRLNVAVTRARQRLIVVSTLTGDMIRPAATASLGVHHLKNFLDYAQHGHAALDGFTESQAALLFESPFEEEVHAFLTERGLQVDTQVGSSGYRLDLAVVHPERPGAYAIAVECDGATYHGSANARERDRLRDEVLQRLGWRIHRVWSTDWWYEPESAKPKLLAAVEEALRAFDDRELPKRAVRTAARPTVEPHDIDALLEEGAKAPSLPAHVEAWPGFPDVRGGPKDGFHEARHKNSLRADLMTALNATSPVDERDLYRHVAQAWGWAGLGRRVVARCEDVLLAKGVDQPTVQDGVIWARGSTPDTYDSFRTEGAGRDAESVPTVEVANAATWVVKSGVSMSRESAVRETARVLGYDRLGKKVASAMEAGVELALRRGSLVEREGRLTAG